MSKVLGLGLGFVAASIASDRCGRATSSRVGRAQVSRRFLHSSSDKCRAETPLMRKISLPSTSPSLCAPPSEPKLITTCRCKPVAACIAPRQTSRTVNPILPAPNIMSTSSGWAECVTLRGLEAVVPHQGILEWSAAAQRVRVLGAFRAAITARTPHQRHPAALSG